MGIRWTVDKQATMRLRFDDEEFLKATQAGEEDEDWKAIDGALRPGVKPQDIDWSEFTGDALYLDARAGISGTEQDAITNAAQQDSVTRGYNVNMDTFNRAFFSTWVLHVSSDDAAVAKGIPADLSSRNKKTRSDAFGELPSVTRQALMARLAVHIRSVERPPEHDPKQSPQTEADSES